MKRVLDEPAFVLHHHDWSESSLILEVFTRNHGRIALMAKGVKRPSSSFRPVLLPLQPLRLNYGGDAEIRTLKAAEWTGGHVMPGGEPLLAGYYLNELLLRLLARDDAHPALFDVYATVVRFLAEKSQALTEVLLRAFELLLLRELGVLPLLDAQTLTLQPLQADSLYSLLPEAGLRLVADSERAALTGEQWMTLQRSLDDPSSLGPVLQACEQHLSALKPQLRVVLQYHCGGDLLRTRALMKEMQQL